jgi:hypothetical protein
MKQSYRGNYFRHHQRLVDHRVLEAQTGIGRRAGGGQGSTRGCQGRHTGSYQRDHQ